MARDVDSRDRRDTARGDGGVGRRRAGRRSRARGIRRPHRRADRRAPSRTVAARVRDEPRPGAAGWDFVVRCRGYTVRPLDGRLFSFDGAALSMSIDGAGAASPTTDGLELFRDA